MSISQGLKRIASHKASSIAESVIREMSRLSAKYKAVNLAQGMPDFPCPDELKQAACQAINENINQYAITWGDKLFRDALSAKNEKYLGVKYDPENEITITCGATEGMMATMLALVDADEEVIVFEPFYENYGPDSILAGARPRYIPLYPPDWAFNEAELEKAFNDKTRALVLNTPHNPTGKVFSREELLFIAALCQKWGVYVFTDEPYEHILYEGARHIAMASLPGMKELTVTVNSLSKTYSVTGWRVGTVCAAEAVTLEIRKVHDFLTIGAPAPLQRAAAQAMKMEDRYYQDLASAYGQRRDLMLEILAAAGIPYFKPRGAYYVFSDISKYGFEDDLKFTEFLVRDVGVAVVPGCSFFHTRQGGKNYIRFCFAKKLETFVRARQRLLLLNEKLKLPGSKTGDSNLAN
jgi:aspartate/methionine/tyrosine aminotransferase